MSLASKQDIDHFVKEAEEILGDRLEDVILYGSYARKDYVPGSDIDILFLVTDKEDNDWSKVSKKGNKYFLDKNIRFSPKILEKDKFENRKNESAGFYNEVSEEGVKL